MKKILLIALLLIPFFGFSQTTKPVDGFLGIKFGSSKAEVIAAVKAKGGQLSQDKADQVVFTGVKLGHLSSAVFFVKFVDDKAYSGIFGFQSDVEDKTIDFYNDLVDQVTGVYGPGKSEKNFRSTFKDGDGYEITAIKEGDADYRTIWRDGDRTGIQAMINDKLYIYLFYRDNALSAQADAKEKAKEKGDF